MNDPVPSDSFKQELTSLLNKHSKDTECNTADFILAEFLTMSLTAFAYNTNYRDRIKTTFS